MLAPRAHSALKSPDSHKAYVGIEDIKYLIEPYLGLVATKPSIDAILSIISTRPADFNVT